jgi:hypothetical protein
LLARLAARERAKTSLILRAHLTNSDVVKNIPGAALLSSPPNGDGEFSIVCPKAQLMDVVSALRKHTKSGAVTAHSSDYIFEANDRLVAAFEKAIRR